MDYYFRFDENGYFAEDFYASYGGENPQPPDVTDVPPPQPMYKVRWDGERWVETGGPPEPDTDALRRAKKDEIGAACNAAIYAGVEVGGRSYSLTIYDQTEIDKLAKLIEDGMTHVPYHADGELCRPYPADEFMPIAEAKDAHILLHRTYCNHVNRWIDRAGAGELGGIHYDPAMRNLPVDLAANMASLLSMFGQGGGGE